MKDCGCLSKEISSSISISGSGFVSGGLVGVGASVIVVKAIAVVVVIVVEAIAVVFGKGVVVCKVVNSGVELVAVLFASKSNLNSPN